MAAKQTEQIIRLLGIEQPETGGSLEYQTLEIDEQPLIHITIGHDLVAYIWLLADPEQIVKSMDKLIEHGQEERQTRKAQRFKLVVATPDPSAVEFTARKTFKDITNKEATTELLITPLAS
jgi:hypothetical protein